MKKDGKALFAMEHPKTKGKRKRIDPSSLSTCSLEDLISKIHKNQKKREKIEIVIDKIVREGIALLSLSKQKKLQDLTEKLIKLHNDL